MTTPALRRALPWRARLRRDVPARALVGYPTVLAAALIWGSIGLFVRGIPAPSTTITFYRVLLGAVGIAVLVQARGHGHHLRPPEARLFRPLMLMALFYTVNWVLFFRAIQLTSLSHAVLGYYTAPAFMAILGHLVLREALSARVVTSIALAFCGLAILFQPELGASGAHVAGLISAVAAGLMYAAAVITAKPITERLAPWTVAFYQTFAATFLLLPFALADGVAPWSLSWLAMGKLMCLGFLHTTVAFALFFAGIKHLRAAQVGVIMYADPLSAVLFSQLVLGEQFFWQTLVGGSLIIGAGIWATAHPGGARNEREDPRSPERRQLGDEGRGCAARHARVRTGGA